MQIEKALLVTAGVAMLVVVSCSPSHPTTENAAVAPVTSATPPKAESKGGVPAAVTNMGEFAENIYDATKAKNWNLAQEKLKALKQLSGQVPGGAEPRCCAGHSFKSDRFEEPAGGNAPVKRDHLDDSGSRRAFPSRCSR